MTAKVILPQMAYEVIKRIGKREYRYRVQSERHPATGKTRNRWTYLGRVAGEREVISPPLPRHNARQRLLDATEALLAGGDATAVTAGAIAARAGVAHGTFYRYFGDRAAALEALARRISETREVSREHLLRDDVATPAEARLGIRRWVSEKLELARQRKSSVRTWHTLIASDARLAAFREEHRASTQRRLSEHLDALAQRGFAQVADAASTAAVLSAMIDGIVRTAILERDNLDEAAITAAAEIAERAIFARLVPPMR